MVHDQNLPDPAAFPLARTVRGPEETLALGREAARLLKGGEVILLYGPLGAGKTCFCQGLGAELGVREEIVSPTFTLVNGYTGGRLPVHHLDFYRVEPHHDLDDIGLPAILDDIYEGRGVLLIEWPEPALAALEPHEPRLELMALVEDTADRRTWRLRGLPDVPPAWARLFSGTADRGDG